MSARTRAIVAAGSYGPKGFVPEPDVAQGAERQGQGVPQRMPEQPGEGAPKVAVDELLSGRAG